VGEEKKRENMLRAFLNYGLVAAILVWAAVVGMMAYHLNESPWRWAFAALSVGGLVTVAGIFWIRKYVDGMNKASDQGSKS
jgi:membrane protein YdbS with pleckstrin-like domain